MVEIEIDGKKVEVQEGSMVMEAANRLGTYIPHFCYHKKLSIAANCRMCLVEIEKAPKPLPACATPVTPGMVVRTHSDKAIKAQKDGRLRPLCVALPRRQARRAPQRCWSADLDERDESLHPLHSLCPFRTRDCWPDGIRHAQSWRAFRDHHLREQDSGF